MMGVGMLGSVCVGMPGSAWGCRCLGENAQGPVCESLASVWGMGSWSLRGSLCEEALGLGLWESCGLRKNRGVSVGILGSVESQGL